MAVVNGVEYQKTKNTPRDQVQSNTWHGRVRCQYDTYEASSLSAGSTIKMGTLPKDARVVDMYLHHDAMGSSVTLAVGDAGDPDRYITAAAASSAGSSRLVRIDGLGFVQAAETDIVVLTAGAAATGTIKLATFYMID